MFVVYIYNSGGESADKEVDDVNNEEGDALVYGDLVVVEGGKKEDDGDGVERHLADKTLQVEDNVLDKEDRKSDNAEVVEQE